MVHLVVGDLLIGPIEARLSLIKCPFQSFLGGSFIDGCSVRWKCHLHCSFNRIFHISLLETIMQLNRSTEFHSGEIHLDGLFVIGRVIDGKSTFCPPTLFDILHQYVTIALTLADIRLQMQRILIHLMTLIKMKKR